jgi:hypothetical protein
MEGESVWRKARIYELQAVGSWTLEINAAAAAAA